MGWWIVQGTQNVLGDAPLDALDSAVSAVVAEYQAAYGRRPTRAEWETLLHTVLGSGDGEDRPLDQGVVCRVYLEVSLDEPPARKSE
jgi:hypothetical protein